MGKPGLRREARTLDGPADPRREHPLVVLLALPLAGTFSQPHPWLPSSLATAPVQLLGTAALSDYLRAVAVALVTGAALVFFAGRRLARREL